MLFSALASEHIHIIDLRWGKLKDIGYAALTIDGDSNVIRNLLTKLRAQCYDVKMSEFYSMWFGNQWEISNLI